MNYPDIDFICDRFLRSSYDVQTKNAEKNHWVLQPATTNMASSFHLDLNLRTSFFHAQIT
jgi:hypothetical protein